MSYEEYIKYILDTYGGSSNPDYSEVLNSGYIPTENPADVVFTGIESGYDNYGATKGAMNYRAKNPFDGPDGTFDSGAKPKSGFFSPFTNFVDSSKDFLKSKGISYDKATGVSYKGKNLGKYIGPAAAAIQGVQALSNVRNAEKLDDSIENLISEIRLTADQSPTLHYDLTADQLSLLKQLESGTYNYSENDTELSDYLMNALSGAAMGAGGGYWGMGLGALGGLANAYSSGMSGGREEALAELEALYQAVIASSQEANAIRRQNALRSVPGYHSYYGGR